MSELPEFSELRPCAKCGGTDIWHAHHVDKYKCSYGSNVRPDCEHIHSGCRRCGWDWASVPLDKEADRE